MCIYSTGELISPDFALQAFIAPAVSTAAIMYLKEYNMFNTPCICRISQFIKQRCVDIALDNLKQSAASNEFTIHGREIMNRNL